MSERCLTSHSTHVEKSLEFRLVVFIGFFSYFGRKRQRHVVQLRGGSK